MLTKLRERLGLYSRADLDRWMSANALDPPSMERLIENEARLEALRRRFGRSIEPALLDELRLGGDVCAAGGARAEEKERSSRNIEPVAPGAAPLSWASQLAALVFRKAAWACRCLTTSIDFASRIGFEDASLLLTTPYIGNGYI